MNTEDDPYFFEARLDRVVDGDTIDLMIDLGFSVFIKQRIRLKNIDAPEIRTRDLEEKARGIAAKERVEELFAKHNNKCYITTEQSKCKYGRYLAHIYFDAVGFISLSEILLEENHAVEYSAFYFIE
jgi:micrococcal nuclease